MGEIADALRRARGIRMPGTDGRQAQAPAAAPERPREDPRLESSPWEALPELGQQVLERLAPTDPAIALSEGGVIEACRKVAVRVRSELETRGASSVAVVSAVRDEGKTTVACNLAIALASMSPGRQVALLDLDLRKPSVSRVLGLGASAGIEDVLHGRTRSADVQVSVRQPALDVYPALAAQRHSHELLVLTRFARLIEQLGRRYDMIVVDTPPVLLVPDASLILKHVATCIPIARAGTTRVRSFRDMVGILPHQAVLGGLLNGGRAPSYYDNLYYSTDEETKRERPPAGKTRREKRRERRAGKR